MNDILLELNEDEASPQSDRRRVCVMGVGQAGVNVLDQIVMHGNEPVDALAIDTDQSVIEGSVADGKLLLGARSVRGMGCTGDIMRGHQIWKDEEFSVEKSLAGFHDLIILVGWGGGSGSAFALDSLKLAKKLGLRTLVVGTMPFSFECAARQETAQRMLEEARKQADLVLTLSNDRMLAWPSSTDNIRSSFYTHNQTVAKAVESLVQILSGPGLVPLEFDDLRALYGQTTDEENFENSWVGSSECSTCDPVEALIEATFQSPLLGSTTSWNEADACLGCLVGGRELGLGDLQSLTKKMEQRLGKKIRFQLGACLDEKYEGRMRLTLMFAKTKATTQPKLDEIFMPDMVAATPKAKKSPTTASKATKSVEEPVSAAKSNKPDIQIVVQKVKAEPIVEEEQVAASPQRLAKEKSAASASKQKSTRQEELPFETNRGRFDNSYETIYRGENLDQPTFRRRKLAIKV